MQSSFKVVVLGDEQSGKTQLVRVMNGSSFQNSYNATTQGHKFTFGVSLASLDKQVQMNCFDLPGKEQFKVLNRMYLRDTNAALICYDASKPGALEQTETWVHELREYAPSKLVIGLCGCKSDKQLAATL